MATRTEDKIEAWGYLDFMETNRILEKLLAGENNELHYEMNPPRDAVRGGTILHLSCSTTSIPHIAYLSQQVLEALELPFVSMGGPENCCGAVHWSVGMDDMADQVSTMALGSFRRTKPVRVVSTCPDCDMLFQLRMTRQHKFRQANVLEVMVENIDRLAELMQHPVNKRVVLHDHDENDSRRTDCAGMAEILSRVPGLEIVPSQHATGLGNHCLMKTGRFDGTVYEPVVREMCDEAVALGADALVLPYHGCYRNHLKRQLQYPFEVFHYLSIIAESIGIPYEEKFKKVRLLDDIDVAMEQILPVALEHGYSEEQARAALKVKVFV